MQAERFRCLYAVLCVLVLLCCHPAAAAEPRAAPESPPPSIGLALGSGGASGLAHIAILGVFDELGVEPAAIAGTSIGAVMGALYAGGLDAAEIRAVFEEFGGSRLDMLSGMLQADAGASIAGLLETDLTNGGVLDINGFLDFLAEKIEARTFAELEIPLVVVATDYWTGKMQVIDAGPLFPALAASMAVPGLFAPVERGDALLIDGGTSNPLPFDLLRDRCEVVVAVDVSGSRHRNGVVNPGMLDLLFKTFDIMQGSLISQRLAFYSPDIYIKVDTSNVRLLDFNRIDEVLERAQPAAQDLRLELARHISKEAQP